MYNILYTEEAKTAIERLSLKKKRQIKDAAERIARHPHIGKRLTQELSGMLSYRPGDFRIIYRTGHNQLLIIILAIGHRKDIYERTGRKSF